MISTGGSFLSVWRMVNCLTTILPKSAERREPPAHTRRKKAQLQKLFARDFPNVYKAIDDLKRKDYRQLAYLLQAHESKIMIDVICRRILDELPGTFIATIHDSIMTTPDKADEVRAIMMREFQRFGLNPMIRLEAY